MNFFPIIFSTYKLASNHFSNEKITLRLSLSFSFVLFLMTESHFIFPLGFHLIFLKIVFNNFKIIKNKHLNKILFLFRLFKIYY